MRGEHVSVLVELTQGTSYENATDTWIPGPNIWEVCYDYQYPEELYRITRHWCTSANAPHPPPSPFWPQFSGCPGVYYPNVMSIQVSNNTPGGCACMTLTIESLTFNVGIGAFGGWRGSTTTCPGAGLTFTVYPVAFAGGMVAWQLDITWPGGSASGGAIYPCGYGPTFPSTIVNAPGICTAADLTVLGYWDWSL